VTPQPPSGSRAPLPNAGVIRGSRGGGFTDRASRARAGVVIPPNYSPPPRDASAVVVEPIIIAVVAARDFRAHLGADAEAVLAEGDGGGARDTVLGGQPSEEGVIVTSRINGVVPDSQLNPTNNDYNVANLFVNGINMANMPRADLVSVVKRNSGHMQALLLRCVKRMRATVSSDISRIRRCTRLRLTIRPKVARHAVVRRHKRSQFSLEHRFTPLQHRATRRGLRPHVRVVPERIFEVTSPVIAIPGRTHW